MTHDERVYHHLYVDSKSPLENAERIATLEELVEGLQAENAKLRGLIVDTFMHPREYCEKYGIEYEGWDSANDHLDARMRELGVEVDNA